MNNTDKHSIEIPYKKIGDYCLPMLTSPDAEHPIGHWGQDEQHCCQNTGDRDDEDSLHMNQVAAKQSLAATFYFSKWLLSNLSRYCIFPQIVV